MSVIMILIVIAIAWLVWWVWLSGDDTKGSASRLFGDCGCGCKGLISERHWLQVAIIVLSASIAYKHFSVA